MRPSELKVPTPWLPTPPPAGHGGLVAVLVKGAIGAGVGALFWFWEWRTLAVVVWALAGVITLSSLASARVRGGLDKGFAALGVFLGQLLSWILLAPLFLVGFTLARGIQALSGRDPLHRAIDDTPTYWHPSAGEARRARRIRSLFAAERITGGGRGWPVLIAGLIALLLVAEVTLRLFGYGDPVLYVNDPVVGYYPAPDQTRDRGGNTIAINGYGMRSAAIGEQKPPFGFRVLVLGDSTAYGGSYLDQRQIFANRMQMLLEAMRKGPVELLNASANGWGPFHQHGYLDVFGTFGADVAVITLPWKDLYRPLTSLNSKPYLTQTPTFALQEVGHHLAWRVRTRAAGKPEQARRDRQAEKGVRAYVELAQRLEAAGVRVIVAVIPSRKAGTSDEVPAVERKWVDRLTDALGDVPLYFPIGFLAGQPDAYVDDVHLGANGHAHLSLLLTHAVQEASR